MRKIKLTTSELIILFHINQEKTSIESLISKINEKSNKAIKQYFQFSFSKKQIYVILKKFENLGLINSEFTHDMPPLKKIWLSSTGDIFLKGYYQLIHVVGDYEMQHKLIKN
ncbi:MAG: hypothetical protein ACTSWL_03560 [Promethearchaeota archaeon]